MSAPPHKTLEDLSGRWTLNRDLSDDPTPALELQGVNFLVRKAAASASVHMTVTQSKDSNGITKISMKQNATSFKIPGTSEDYILDGEWRDDHDPVFGGLKGRSKWTEKGDIEAEGNKRDGSWGGTHVWGFEDVNGEGRRHVRWIRIWHQDDREVKMRMVYDFDGE